MLLTTYVSTLWKSQSSIEANTQGNNDAIITQLSTRNIADAWNSTKIECMCKQWIPGSHLPTNAYLVALPFSYCASRAWGRG